MSQPIYLVVLRIKIIGLAYTGIFPVNEIVISAWLVTAARLRPVRVRVGRHKLYV